MAHPSLQAGLILLTEGTKASLAAQLGCGVHLPRPVTFLPWESIVGVSAWMQTETGDVLTGDIAFGRLGGYPGTLGVILVFTHPQIRKLLLNIYLFGCAGSQLQHTGVLILTVACEIWFPEQGLNLGPLHWGAMSLNHWTTREVPRFRNFK